MSLNQVHLMRSFLATMLPEWHGYHTIAADMLLALAPATSDRHAALHAASCFGTFILFLLMLGYASSTWHDPQQSHHAGKDNCGDATVGNGSSSASDDFTRPSQEALLILNCARHANFAAPNCPGPCTHLHVVPKALAIDSVALPPFTCVTHAPYLGFACMPGSGVVDLYATLDCCNMQASMISFLMHYYICLDGVTCCALSTHACAVFYQTFCKTGMWPTMQV